MVLFGCVEIWNPTPPIHFEAGITTCFLSKSLAEAQGTQAKLETNN